MVTADISLTIAQANEIVGNMTDGAMSVGATGFAGHECVHLCRVGETMRVRLLHQDMTRTGLAIAVARLEL